MNNRSILFVNHKAQKCGVYEFGLAIGNVLVNSKKYNFIYREVDSLGEFKEICQQVDPLVVIYNYSPTTMGWISEWNGLSINSHKVKAIQIGIIHDVTQKISDISTDWLFDYYIAADPTLLLKNPIVYKTGRLVPHFENKPLQNSKITIGSFGFATYGKGFIKIIDKVAQEFDEAIINLNISFAKFGDERGNNARKLAEIAKKSIKKKGIMLNISHDHHSIEGLLEFLSRNDLNIFLYEYQEGRGISSATDWAIAVKKPLVVNKSSMFRHLFDCYPSICIEDNSLKTILGIGVKHLERLSEEWSPENLLWDYERIIDDIIKKNITSQPKSHLQKKLSLFLHMIHTERITPPASHFFWLKKDDQNIFSGFINKNYEPIRIGDNHFNQILDNSARERYKPALNFIKDVAPEINAKKIPEANIQQAFVFDTAYRIANPQKQSIKILAVGAFEDTAAIALKKLGFPIEFIDPTINYDLSTFITKPSVKDQSFDIIISTSVIEHVEDDEKFIQDIAFLLKVGGWGILTCDFNDAYKEGEKLPQSDFRFYTKKDFLERLLPSVPNCILVDEPDWDCQDPDFFYDDCRYTFASLVFQKVQN